MGEHETDCGCAVCDTHIMGGTPDGWTPDWELMHPRRCTFCRQDKTPTYANVLGFVFCADCTTRQEKK